MKTLLAALLLAFPLAAQIQLLSLDGASPIPLGPSFNLGSAAVAETTEFRFRARNAGIAPAVLQTLSVNGAAFSLAQPFTPLTLAPAQSFDFVVRFLPPAPGSYSASLTANSFTSLIRASASPGPSILLTLDGQSTEITGPSLEIRAATAQSLPIALSLSNPHSAPLSLSVIALTGEGFSLDAAPALPAQLLPGESLALPVTFRAAAPGDYTGLLTAGPRRLRLLASVVTPSLGRARFVTSSPAPANGQQLRIRLEFDEPAAVPASGTLRATFSGAVDDPAVLFPNGRRDIDFQVAAGSRDASFNGAPETIIQTGTTAGSLRLEATAGSSLAVETYNFAPAIVAIDSSSARRNGSTIEIDLTGFDNTRAAGSLNFRFFDRSGNPIGGVITSNIPEIFRSYFDRSPLGGVFRLRAAFPVSGDATIVGSVLVEIANSVGRTELPRLNFP
jgi:hypothetical protein